MLFCILNMLLSVTALWVALRKPSARRGMPKARPRKGVHQRQMQAVARKEWENFMNYDGTEQAPIDPDRVLGD